MNRLRNGFVAVVVLMGFAVSSGMAQTTVAASATGVFRHSTSANGTTQNPSNAAGFLLEVRHIWNPLMGIEATYSFHKADEDYSKQVQVPVPGLTESITAKVPANAHEVTADWVASFSLANLKPFALAGYGLLLDVPTTGNVTATTTTCGNVSTNCSQSTGSIPTQTQAKGVFVYGAGVDVTLLPHIGLRLQYRGNVYKAADLAKEFTSTDKFTQDAEPMAGVFIRF